MTHKRILAVDYGESRTGLAVSDQLGITAQGLPTFVASDPADIPRTVLDTARDLGATLIVVGLPRNMNGTDSAQTEAVRRFGDTLAGLSDIPVTYWDERLTSLQAARVMRETGTRTRNNKNLIDRISATIILQDYLKTLP